MDISLSSGPQDQSDNQSFASSEASLSELAMDFRSAQFKAKRDLLVEDYVHILEAMMSQGWKGVLDVESELPDEFMPRAYLIMVRPGSLNGP